jgi:hypothetical protein
MGTSNTIGTIMLALMAIASAKELPVNMKLKAEMYENGVVHEHIMATKHVSDNEYNKCHPLR